MVIPSGSERAASNPSGRATERAEALEAALCVVTHFTPSGAATPLILYPQHPASSSLRCQFTLAYAALLRTSCRRDISPSGLPSRYARPPAFFPSSPLSFNPLTNLSLNPFRIRNPTNITSASATLPDSLSPLTYSADVFPSLLPLPSSLPIRSALPPLPTDPSLSSPISGGPPPSFALSCSSQLSPPHPLSSTPCLSPPPRPLTVGPRAPTVFPGF